MPTLVLGYSIKSRGIATDLFGTDENYVIPVQKLQEKEDLAGALQWIIKNENEIKKQLEEVIPISIEKAKSIAIKVKKFC